jgi:hypothetical protein
MGPWLDQGGNMNGYEGTSGPGWYDRHLARKQKFLADHPEWSVVYVRSLDRYEASTGDTDTELVLLMDQSLGELMTRLEARYAPEQDTPSES